MWPNEILRENLSKYMKKYTDCKTLFREVKESYIQWELFHIHGLIL